MKMIVIAGWGLGTAVLEPLVQLLINEGHQVELWDIFDPFDLCTLNEKLNRAEHAELLIGWSLGGQLALYLADSLNTQRQINLPVICCMSNPCFVSHEDWLSAMPQTQYEQFSILMEQNPNKGLQRFCHLVTMGSETPLQRTKILQSHLSDIDLNYQKKHLYLLKLLDLTKILQTFSNKFLFLMCDQDQLVPYQVIHNLHKIAEDRIKVKILNGAHDVILFEPNLIFASILHFIESENLNDI